MKKRLKGLLAVWLVAAVMLAAVLPVGAANGVSITIRNIGSNHTLGLTTDQGSDPLSAAAGAVSGLLFKVL